MIRKGWKALIGLSTALILAFLATTGRGAVAHLMDDFSSPRDDSASAVSLQQGPTIFLSLTTSPSAVAPGENFSLILELSNSLGSPVNPLISVDTPSSVSIDISSLPAGSSYDVQNSKLSWQPILQGAGSRTTAAINFTANVADMQKSLQTISVGYWDGLQEQIVSTEIWIGILPMATINFDPPQVAIGQPIQLKGTVSGPGPITQEWFLGDGRVVNALDPIVVYPVTGKYDITLKASNPLGSSSVGAIINVIPQPIAHFEPSDLTVSVGQDLTFRNESGGEPTLTFSWEFGDGFGSQQASPQHRYNEPGTYLIHLVVENGFGRSESYAQITVADPPIADAIIPANSVAGQVLETTAFTDDSVTEIIWDMGDGRSKKGANARHVYWSAGDYQITMTAFNEFGSKSISQWIHVDSGPLFLYLPLSMAFGSTNSDQPPLEYSEEAPLDTVVAAAGEELEPLQFPENAGPADKLLAYINQARVGNNMRPLRYVHELSIAAQRHVDDMAASGFVGHTGSDESIPELRIQQSGYPGGYGGEATAWGMEDPIDPVIFWLSSPGHRAILLHPGVSDVGVGFALNYNSPNIWYWTAEFGSLSLPAIIIQPTAVPEVILPPSDVEAGAQPEPPLLPEIQLLGPPQYSQIDLSSGNRLIFTWSWGQTLAPGQGFVVALNKSGEEVILGMVESVASGDQYQLLLTAEEINLAPGEYLWQVRVVDGSGSDLATSVPWTIHLGPGGSEDQHPPPTVIPATATPEPTETPQPVIQPTSIPIATPLPTREP